MFIWLCPCAAGTSFGLSRWCNPLKMAAIFNRDSNSLAGDLARGYLVEIASQHTFLLGLTSSFGVLAHPGGDRAAPHPAGEFWFYASLSIFSDPVLREGSTLQYEHNPFHCDWLIFFHFHKQSISRVKFDLWLQRWKEVHPGPRFGHPASHTHVPSPGLGGPDYNWKVH